MTMEMLSSVGEFKSLDNLSDLEIADLKSEIIANRHIATVIIHPFYKDERDNTEETVQNLAKYEEKISEILKGNKSSIFIFEEAEKTGLTTAKIKHINSEARVVFIPTFSNSPTPINCNEGLSKREVTWQEVIKTFSNLGIRKIQIGGKLFYRIEPFGPMGCVVDAKAELQTKFKVSYIPGACFPDNPKKMFFWNF